MDRSDTAASRSLQAARSAYQAGRTLEAERLIVAVIRATPHCEEAYLLLADIEAQLGNCARVVLALREAISLNPENAPSWFRLGTTLSLQARWSEAMEAHAEAVRLAPVEPQYLGALAVTQIAGQRYDQAAATSRHMTASFSTHPHSHLIEGHLCKVRGLFTDSAAAYKRALELDPTCANALFNLIELCPGAPEPRREHIRKLLDRVDLRNTEIVDLELALARICERRRHFDAAFSHYQRANDARRMFMQSNGLTYSVIESEKRVEAIVSNYSGAAPERRSSAPSNLVKPIFIVGMPRSGTTLVEQILSCHPLVSAGGELTAVGECHSAYVQRRKILNLPWPPDPDNTDEVRLLEDMRERYFDLLFASRLNSEYVTDKFPGNFALLGFIRQMFPDVTLVHCIRHPVATCWSLYSTHLAVHSPYCTSLAHLAHHYGLYQRLMNHWRTTLTPPIIEVRYEQLVQSQEEETRRLLCACGLSWDEGCLHPHRNPRPVATASVLQVRRPVYQSSVNAWKNYARHLKALRGLEPAYEKAVAHSAA